MITGSEQSKVCKLLSNMYLCSPTKRAIENWKSLLSEDIPDFMLDFKNAIDAIDINSKQELEDLLWEYTRLFIGPYKLPCPPWESVYTSSKKLMVQEAYDEVRDFYKELGLTVNDPDIMPDHIGVELNFISVLFEKMNDESERRLYYMDIANRFIDEHLMKWVPQFTQDMENAANSSFYKTLAQVTKNFIMNECNFITLKGANKNSTAR